MPDYSTSLTVQLLWLVPALPALGAAINGFMPGGLRSARLCGSIACAAVGLSLAVSLIEFSIIVPDLWCRLDNIGLPHGTIVISYFDWIPVGDAYVCFSLILDPTSFYMVLIVNLVGLLIHIYSIGYMAKDLNVGRFFVYMNIFMAMMLLLVLANSLLVMFIGWEGVGLCSYLLIGFWHERESASRAGLKAFLVNRVGDAAFIVGIVAAYKAFGTLAYYGTPDAPGMFDAGLSRADPRTLHLIAALLFIGAIGKSAQFPLHVWLPDAMEGPTPVSALIHAATMVAAGVYMIARCHPLFEQAAPVALWVAGIGAGTALFAATIAIAQNDIKRVLAYSTISQLGYMFLAAGVGAYTAALFHLGTHAFFKALLFLGAGSVMHAMHDELDIQKMGGLRRWLPQTHLTFLIGTLAIAGIYPLSGFFSKDEILASAFEHARGLWLIGLATAALTALYMGRLMFLVFWGKPRMKRREHEQIHESPRVMTWPMWVLAFFTATGGFMGLRDLTKGWPPVCRLPVVPADELGLAAFALAAGLLGLWVAHHLFVRRLELVPRIQSALGPIYILLERKYFCDEIYKATIVDRLSGLADYCGNRFDPQVIDGLVNGVARCVGGMGEGLRRTQSSLLRHYALGMLLGCTALLAYLFLRFGF